MNLLSTNPKVEKGESAGWLTYILHLAPSWLSGRNTCPGASPGCATACLNSSGRGGIGDGSGTLEVCGQIQGKRTAWSVQQNRIQRARIRKTHLYFDDRPEFMRQLARDIEAAQRKANREGMRLAIRLNGTSDLRFERVPVGGFENIFEMFSGVQFYDYTKLPNRRGLPANYHLTFSLSECNDDIARTALDLGTSVAVAMRLKKGEPMPDTWGGYPCIDGDTTDLRFLDPAGVIVGLRAKGRGSPSAANKFFRDPAGGFRCGLPVIA